MTGYSEVNVQSLSLIDPWIGEAGSLLCDREDKKRGQFEGAICWRATQVEEEVGCGGPMRIEYAIIEPTVP
jgi:hypothetical protein